MTSRGEVLRSGRALVPEGHAVGTGTEGAGRTPWPRRPPPLGSNHSTALRIQEPATGAIPARVGPLCPPGFSELEIVVAFSRLGRDDAQNAVVHPLPRSEPRVRAEVVGTIGNQDELVACLLLSIGPGEEQIDGLCVGPEYGGENVRRRQGLALAVPGGSHEQRIDTEGRVIHEDPVAGDAEVDPSLLCLAKCPQCTDRVGWIESRVLGTGSITLLGRGALFSVHRARAQAQGVRPVKAVGSR